MEGRVATAVILMVALTTPCGGQSLQPQPRVEVGAVASGFLGSSIAAVGLRTTIHADDQSALELALDSSNLFQNRRHSDHVMWFYSWQMRHPFARRGPGSALFLSYGTLGFTHRETQPGSQDRHKTAVVLPFLPLVGIGGQRVLSGHLALRGDLQFLIGPFETGPLQPRVTGGVSIPIGRYRR